MKLYSKDGIELMEIKSIERSGDDVVIKGKMMKSMAVVVHVKPADVWSAFRLVPVKLLLAVPGLVLKGRQQTKAAKLH